VIRGLGTDVGNVGCCGEVMSEKRRGRMKRKPRWEGKRKVGIAEKRREIVLAIPKALPSNGAVSSAVRSALGAMSARTGRRAMLKVKGLVMCGVMIPSVER